MNRILGILLLAVGLFFLAVSGKAMLTVSETTKQIENAVLVTDGRMNPANEGKRVMLVVDPSQVGGAYDERFYLSFDSPCVRRCVEVFSRDVTRDEDGEYQWTWKDISWASSEEVKSETFVGGMDGSAMKVSPDLLKFISTDTNCTRSMLKPEEVEHLSNYVYVSDELDGIYFSEAPDYCLQNKLSGYEYAEYEGARRIHYRVLSEGKYDTFAWVGVQHDGVLERDENLDANPFFGDLVTPEAAAAQNRKQVLLGAALTMAASLAALFFAVRMIMGKGKKS